MFSDASIAAAMRTFIIAMVMTGCVTPPLAAQPTFDTEAADVQAMVVDSSSLDPAAPTPASVLGHRIGDGAAPYEATVRYLQALAQSSPLVSLTPYAQSHEGRTLYYLTITSSANHARLDDIKADNAKLADPRLLTSTQEGDRLTETLPGIAWLAYSIHGDELSSTDAALMVAYQLAAGTDERIATLRNELVIHIDPLMNPDGRERYLHQLQHLTGKVPNPDYQAMQHRGLWSAGRGNHYLFDLNRDWLMQVHPETRGRTAEILSWNPHLVVDSHEMGSMDTYLFEPPREPFNTELSATNLAWRRHFSADQAKAFDRHGWSYYTREWYEEWYPGYTNAWANLLGAVGILYEQAGVNAASVKQRSGRTLSYQEAVHHHVVSSLANLETLRVNRHRILRDYLADRQWAVTEQPGKEAVFLLPPHADRSRARRFVDLLQRQGIEVHETSQPCRAQDVSDIWGDEADEKTFPARTLVVRSAQPHRRLLVAALGFDPHMSSEFLQEEREELENRRGTRMYDTTAWNLSMAYGLEAYWASRISEVELTSLDQAQDGDSPALPAGAGYGYLVNGADGDVYPLIARLLGRDCNVRCAHKPFTIAGRTFQPGTILLRNHENPDDLATVLHESRSGLQVDIQTLDTALSENGPDLGGRTFKLLVPPRVAIASQWPMSTTSFGATWHLLDYRMGLRASPLNVQSLGFYDLRRYNVIVLPHVWRTKTLVSVLSERVRKELKSWVESGGTLIAIGGSATFLANKDRGLSAVRAKRDVLDQLKVYAEDVERERDARDVTVDPAKVWGTGALRSDDKEQPEDGEKKRNEGEKRADGARPKPDVEALKREDAWERVFAPRGVFVASTLDPEHWLCFGLGEKLPVWIHGPYALMSKHPVQTPVRLNEAERLRLSGLLWPEARRRWAGTAYATVERVGKGQIVLFASDPAFRGFMEGTGRLFLNALILGPGLGTSQPVPW